MPRHRDPADSKLFEQLEDTRSALAAVIDALAAQGVKRTYVARAAQWSPGYLSQFMTSDRMPSSAKVRQLIRVLLMLIWEHGVPQEAADGLRRVAELYDVTLGPPADPAGPIPSTAANHVLRAELAWGIATCLDVGHGLYAVDGPAMSGVTTTLLYIGALLEKDGCQVAHVDADWQLSAERISRSRTGLFGAFAAALIESDDALDLEFYALESVIGEHLRAATPALAVLIDNVNCLAHPEQQDLRGLLRHWQTRRACGEAGFGSTTVWMGYTSRAPIDELASRSLNPAIYPHYVLLRPFTREDVLGLARALVPLGVASGAIPDGDRADIAARDAWAHFAGQPHLTHVYLWRRMRDGSEAVDDEILAAEGQYERHLRRLAFATIGLIGADATRSLAERLREGREDDGGVHLRMLVGLGIVDVAGRCTSRYYAAQLPGAFERAIAWQARLG